MRIINLTVAMKAVEEIVHNSPGLSFCFQERDEPLNFSWHYHREYEITFVAQGSGKRFVGDDVSSFGPRDLVLVGPYVPHAYESSPSFEDVRTIIIQFSPELFAAERLRLKELRHVHKLLRRAENGLAFDAATSTEVLPIVDESARHAGLEKLVDLIRILDVLARTARCRSLASEWYRRDSTSIDLDGPREDADLLQFIFTNACGPLMLKDAAEFAGFSVSSLCRFFKRRIGCTFNEYLTRIRISEACKLLIETDLPVYAVSYQVGFENLSNFNRRFRRMKGMTPSTYRWLHQRRLSELPRVRSASSA